jgi:hypothetical protein
VYVDGVPLGIWLTSGANPIKRWAESDFLLPSMVTAGRRRISVELRVRAALGAPTADATGWSDFRYTALTITTPR